MFTLHPQLARDTLPVTDWRLCRVLLMNNRLFPWLILVPQREDIREILDIESADRHLLMDEIAAASQALQTVFAPDKLNMAALGNQVPQLHIHIIARYVTDSAWPNPVWGKGSEPYADPGPVVLKLRQTLI